MAVSDSGVELHDDPAVSLADDPEDMWGTSQKPKPFCFYHPVALKCSTMDQGKGNVFGDKKFDIMIFKVPEKKQVPNGNISDPYKSRNDLGIVLERDLETVGPELFDELCSSELRFDASVKNFGAKELKAYNVLKRQWSKWQDGFNLYQEFCSPTKFEKHST